MIIRDAPKPWELLFILRGSIVPAIRIQLLAVIALASLVTTLTYLGILSFRSISPLPFSLIGIALSIFSGFRNSASYERWWEARKILGQHVVEARSVAREALAYLGPGQGKRLVELMLVFTMALKSHLRGEEISEETLAYAKACGVKFPAGQNVPEFVLRLMSEELASKLKANKISPQMVQVLEERIVSMSGVLAAAERIRFTPLPFAYSLLLHRTAYLFCILLPFGLVEACELWTPLVTGILAYTFFGLDALGDQLAAPFGREPNCMPLDSITRTIEISLLHGLGRKDVPEPILAENFTLS